MIRDRKEEEEEVRGLSAGVLQYLKKEKMGGAGRMTEKEHL